MRSYSILVGAVLGILWVNPAVADFKKGADAYQKGDYASAFKEWKTLAEQGDATAQYVVGMLYALGEGVPIDLVRSYMWESLAVSNGASKILKEEIETQMTPDQIAKGQKLFRECLKNQYKDC